MKLVQRRFLAYCRVRAIGLEPVRETINGNGKICLRVRAVLVGQLDTSAADDRKGQPIGCVESWMCGLYAHRINLD
jgi:hypothetical protein